jgi:GNAT superfamily N-acetyltransferase
MQYMERWCKDRGADRIVLTSANRRLDSHKFYDAIGYERTGIRFSRWL